MAEYRTVKMAFWTDPYIESLSAEGKLLYIYFFTCPLVSNLGIIETTVKRIAYETDIDAKRVATLLDAMEKSGKLVRDGNVFWLTNFIKNQCTTSPKLLQSMKAMLQNVESKKIRHALCIRYPHIFECSQEEVEATDTISIPYRDGTSTVSIPSGEIGNRNIEQEEEINPPSTPPRGADTPRKTSPYSQEFETFWKEYPNKTGKDAAYRAWQKKKREKRLPELPELIPKLQAAKASEKWQRDGGEFIPNPSTWINQARWLDELPEEAPRQAPLFESIWDDERR